MLTLVTDTQQQVNLWALDICLEHPRTTPLTTGALQKGSAKGSAASGYEPTLLTQESSTNKPVPFQIQIEVVLRKKVQ